MFFFLYLLALRILDEKSTVSVPAEALTHELDKIEVYSNSWGYPGNGYGFDPLYEIEEAALIQGITKVISNMILYYNIKYA